MRAYRVFKGCLVGLVGALAVAACSGKEAPAKGQIMVVLQSDMAIPKDFNRVRVDISVRGQKVFSDTYVADVTGSLVLPGTIAVVAGEEDAPSVEVKVVGISMANEAQTFSKVITTMPRTRIATLRVPMQWLCVGQTIQLGKGVDAEYESSCQPAGGVERSCVAGECVDVHVNEADLPTYSAPDVFGGGEYANDPSGTCFDVQECFRLGVDLAPDLDPESPTYCQAAIAVPENFEVNFAVKTPPGGAGVCDDDDESAPCYVVLDQSETFGWKAADGDGPPAMVVDGGGGATGAGGRAGGASGSGAVPVGGTTGTAGAGVAGGAVVGGGPSGGSGPGGNEGYIESGSWHGHVFLAASPATTVINFEQPPKGFPLCVFGTVAGTADSSGYASVGFYLNQPAAQAPEPTFATSKLGGISLNLFSDVVTPFRINLGGPDAMAVPTQNWCAQISATEQLVPWSLFSNNCWAGQGAAYDAELDEISFVSIVVPGSPDPLPFDFCVHQLVEENIPQRLSPGQKTLSLRPPGVRPQQSGGAEGSVIVQFPTAVCDRLIEDDTLGLRGTAACDKKTEKTPICGPWSSAQAPQVPNPAGMLADTTPTDGAGGAGSVDGAGGAPMSGEGGVPSDGGAAPSGGSGGSGKAGAGAGGAGHPPAMCEAVPAHAQTNSLIAGFDGALPEPLIDNFDGRMGYAFSVAYGTCEPGTFSKVTPGALGTPAGIAVELPACNAGGENAVGVFVPFNSTLPTAFDGGAVPVPDQVCMYDANPYQTLQLHLQASTGQALRVGIVTADNLSIDDQIPGGKCLSNCVVPYQTIDVGVGWLGYPISMTALEVDRSQLLGFMISPLSPSPLMQLDIDEIQFGGLP